MDFLSSTHLTEGLTGTNTMMLPPLWNGSTTVDFVPSFSTGDANQTIISSTYCDISNNGTNETMKKDTAATDAAAAAAAAEADRPKRGRSAYNYFFRAERAKILGISEEELDAQQHQKRKHRKTPGMMGFAKLASYVGDRWRMLSEEEKAPYQRKCDEDRERYNRELKAWRKKHDKGCDISPFSTFKNEDNIGDPVQNNNSILNKKRKYEESISIETDFFESTDASLACALPPVTPGMSNTSKRRRQDAEQLVREMRLAGGEIGMVNSFDTTSAIGVTSVQGGNEETQMMLMTNQHKDDMRRLADAFEPTPIQEMATARTSMMSEHRYTRGQAGALQDLYDLTHESPEWQNIFHKF